MKMLLQRTHMTEAGTFGKLFADDTFLCYTLEDPVREIEGQPVATWKIKGKTAIPQGTYRITLETSARFGPETLTVNAVPGFEGVRMHAGNTQADTEGCPLLGMAINAQGLTGGTSRPAVTLVKNTVMTGLARDLRVMMKITNP